MTFALCSTAPSALRHHILGHRTQRDKPFREYPRITNTFDQAKSRIAVHRQAIAAKAGIVRHGDMALAYEVEKNATLKAKIERLERENRDLLEQFQRWQYNAQTNGLSPEILNRPLPTRKTHHDRQTYKKRERGKREEV